MHPTTDHIQTDALLASLSERLSSLVHSLVSWTLDPSHTLADIETHVLRLSKDLASHLLTGLLARLVPSDIPRSLPCSCGATAFFQRIRSASVLTTLGQTSIPRPYYLCPSCHHGFAPLDEERAICAGGRSLALDELLALLGATQDSFAQAATVLERLTLVHLSSTTLRDATESLGATLVDHQRQRTMHLQAGHEPASALAPCPALDPPSRLYISMDGVSTHLHERGWSEFKVGAWYQTTTRRSQTAPEQHEIHADHVSYITALCDAETFGWHLWQEATRRGVEAAKEVVVVADGAHWIWNIAELHFPQATQIVDWYHASSYVWKAAKVLWEADEAKQQHWARMQLSALWDGRVEQVLAELRQRTTGQEMVEHAMSYYTTHRGRMKYAEYRGRGVQIGSGTIESGCKQVVSERLKGAGMIGSAEGGEQVAMVRAWQRSGRWEEAMGLRERRRRGYVRKEQQECGGEEGAKEKRKEECMMGQSGKVETKVSAEQLAQLRAELFGKSAVHPWRKAWSKKRQREEQRSKRALTI